jgi:Holliday junction resolvase YEN1
MGIPEYVYLHSAITLLTQNRLRPVIEACEEIVPLAKLAQDCNDEHDRPFKIAIDVADWVFHNVSPSKRYSSNRVIPRNESLIQSLTMIRSAEESAANPVEKGIFFRVLKLLTLNIWPMFVFDGPNVPAKRTGTEGRKISPNARALLKEALDRLYISWIEAPGEAEAECCRLQILELVDAVWSQDSDCLMFGCALWIRELRTARDIGNSSCHIGDTQKDHTRVIVVRAEKLKMEQFQLNREGCVLFAMLVGGDYDRQGLRGCGTVNALKLVKASLDRSLCSLEDQKACNAWRDNVLPRFLKSQKINLVPQKDFPKFNTLQKYNNPVTHSDTELRKHARDNSNHDKSPVEADLLAVACVRFNFWSKKYYDHIGPVLLSRALAARSKSLPREVIHDSKLIKGRTKATVDEHGSEIPVRKLTFPPMGVSSLTKAEFERRESTRAWKTDTTFYPDQRVLVKYQRSCFKTYYH